MNVPKRIVLSRKGFDTTRGGGRGASPIFGDRLLSVPIPEPNGRTGRTYSDLWMPSDLEEQTNCTTFAELLKKLGRQNFGRDTPVHLDPDIREDIRPADLKNQIPAFGQDSRSLTELSTRDVGMGTLFLFFGLFQAVEYSKKSDMFRYVGKRKHVIWGWLEVLKTIQITPEALIPEAVSRHAHVLHRKEIAQPNAVYLAADRLSFGQERGFGEFRKIHPSLILSSSCARCRCDDWTLPETVANRALTRPGNALKCSAHHEKVSGYRTSSYTGQGQEFIFDTVGEEEAFRHWLSGLFSLPPVAPQAS